MIKSTENFTNCKLPYGGVLLKQPSENMLVDFNQYQRVVNKGEVEKKVYTGSPLWPNASKNVFGLLKWRKSLEEHELEAMK